MHTHIHIFHSLTIYNVYTMAKSLCFETMHFSEYALINKQCMTIYIFKKMGPAIISGEAPISHVEMTWLKSSQEALSLDKQSQVS